MGEDSRSLLRVPAHFAFCGPHYTEKITYFQSVSVAIHVPLVR